MNYPICLYQIETTNGLQWMAEFPDIQGCVGAGTTAEEALDSAWKNLEFHLEGIKELGLCPPVPSSVFSHHYSGKLSLRLSKGLHRKAALAAQREGISINQLIVEALSERIGKQSS